MRSTKPKILKAVSILLVLLSIIGATVSAEVLNPVVSRDTSEPVIVEEDISLRGTYEKHFIMSDGSSMAVAYNEPVHYEEDGQWFEIDNTLVETKGGGRISNVKGLENVSFSQEPSQELVVIEKEGYTISWGLRFSTAPNAGLSASGGGLKGIETRELDPKATARVEEPDYTGFEGADQLMLARNAGQLTYENAAGEGVDVEYTVLPGRVKEAIILESPQSIVSYIMDITAEGLTASVNEAGEIVFSDGTEVIFTIWAPYMYDSADELSEEIEVDLSDNGNGSYTVTLTPDAEWLNDEARVYPITIDPDVSAGTDQANGIDNSVEQGSGVITHTLDRLYAGKRNGKKRRFYQKFKTMPTIPSGATISSATQTFYVTSGTSTGNSLKAHRVDSDWSSKTITWSNKPLAFCQIQSNIGHNGLTRYNIDMKSAVKTWYTRNTTGQNKNYGIMVQYQNETISDFNTVYSADFATAAKRPQLKINYSGGSAPTPTPTPTPRPTPTPSQSGGPASNLYYGKEYYIMNKRSGQYLTVQGTNVQQSKFSDSASQRWKIVHAGNGESHLVSMKNQSYALFISGNSANNDANVIVDTNKSASGSRFKISTNNDCVTYRILSKPSGFSKVVVVQGASCNVGQNVIQYSYNSTANDEWFFVPVKIDVSLGKNYAMKCRDGEAYHLTTFPWLYGEEDYGNFVSQCLLAQGVRYRDKWYIYKKKDGSPNQMHSYMASSYWDYDVLSESEMSPYGSTSYGYSPWFNATAFWAFWGPRLENVAYTTDSIFPDSDRQEIINEYYKSFYKKARSKFGRGDVVQIITSTSSWEGGDGAATRSVKTAMYIVDICIIDGHSDFMVAWENQGGKVEIGALKQVLETYPRSESVYCRFFRSSKAN